MRRLIGLISAGVILVGAAVVAKAPENPSDKMRDAAEAFLKSLSPELRKKAEYPFDSPQRLAWFFTPVQKDKKPMRKGLRLEEMTADQRGLLMELVKTGTSATGYKQASTIISLEEVLRAQEKNGAMGRNPEWYFVSVFGTPSKSASWGWRFEGHHLSMNVTVEGERIDSATPMVFGANPAEVRSGERKGLRTLPETEDAARDLIAALGDEGRKAAKQEKHFPEVGENTPKAKVGDPVGVAHDKMDAKGQATLLKLVEAYTNRMPPELADSEWKRIRKDGLGTVFFAYSGTGEKGTPWTYRVQGKTFLIEFLNNQTDGEGNANNHIHSSWRRLPADFGL